MKKLVASDMTLATSWCARQDLNLHARAMEPKSIVSANSTTGAYTGELRSKRPPVA